jgi:hypothetical protein
MELVHTGKQKEGEPLVWVYVVLSILPDILTDFDCLIVLLHKQGCIEVCKQEKKAVSLCWCFRSGNVLFFEVCFRT